jgi:hypothetical protein
MGARGVTERARLVEWVSRLSRANRTLCPNTSFHVKSEQTHGCLEPFYSLRVFYSETYARQGCKVGLLSGKDID